MTRRRIPGLLVAAAVLGTLVVGGCSQAVAPSDSTRILHVSNRIGSAAVVQGTNLTGATSSSRVLAACGGEISVNPTTTDSIGGEYEVAVLLDPSGGLDAAVVQANGDLAAVDTSALALAGYWRRSGLKVVDLPQWIIIAPDGITITGHEPTSAPVEPPCDPFGPTPEP